METSKLGIRAAFGSLGAAFRLWWSDWANGVLVCLAMILLSLTVIGHPIAVFGLYEVSKDLSHGTRSGLGGFWRGIKDHYKQALLWGLVNTLGLLILAFNLWFYVNSQFAVAVPLAILNFSALMLWLFWQYYSLAAFFLQEPQTLKLAWKNGWALLFGQPGFSLPIAFTAVLLFGLALRFFIPLALGVPAFCSLAGILAVQTMIGKRD